MLRPTKSAPAGWRARAAGVLLALIFSWGWAPAVSAASLIDYLYVEANEGDSSGGHVAIRFGEETFHFQQESPGILRIRRDDAAAFHHIYAMLGNRTIHESRISVSDDTYALLHDAFTRLLMVQDAQAEQRAALLRDTALFELLLKQRESDAGGGKETALPVKALGYFEAFGAHPFAGGAESAGSKEVTGVEGGAATKESADSKESVGSKEVVGSKESAGQEGGAEPPAVSAALAALRNRIIATYGEGLLSEREAQARATIRDLKLRAVAKPVVPLSRDSLPVFDPVVSTRYDDALHALFAIELLRAAPPLRKGAFWTSHEDAFKLGPKQALALRAYAARLETDLVRLADSRREEWGTPFMLGMARLAAIEASLASGRLVLLDIFMPQAKLQRGHDAALRRYLPLVERDLREIFLQKRKEFFAGEGVGEAEYAVMERTGNLLLDVERARATGSALRAVPKETFPSLPATVVVPLPGEPDRASLERELKAARGAEREYAKELTRLYGYHLFRHNCVTELFAVINGALTPPGPVRAEADPGAGAPLQAESVKRLGGYVDASSGLEFIPIFSAGAVERSYAVVASRDIPSYRMERVAEMKTHEPAIKVFFRESNTITSSVYRPGPDDSAFLFFTNDNVPLRPLFGVFNLLVGLGQGVLGVVTMPVTGPDRFLSGARGVAFSLPELVFINLRKGSMAYVERDAEKAR